MPTAEGSDPDLVAAYTGEPVRPAMFLGHLRDHLPVCMVPQRYQHSTAFPLNPNGKVDRRRLRELLSQPAN